MREEKKPNLMKDFKLFDEITLSETGNTVKPKNDYIEFKREDINQSIISRFEEQVRLHRDRVAVKSNNCSLSYAELNREANRLVHSIQEKYDDRYQLTNNEKTRYQRQMLLHKWGIESQGKLKSTTVFAAGAGGSGSPLIMQLALAGFGTIIICDYDKVELSNLNRQVLHDESRINMNKALSARKTVERINPHVKVIAYAEKITRDNVNQLVGDAAIIFDNIDDMEAKFVLSQCAVEKQIPHIISSMIDMNSYAAIFHTPHTPCFHCLYDINTLKEIEELKTIVKNYKKNPNSVVSPSLFLSTGFAVNEAIKILLGFENPAYNKYFLFNQRGTRDIINSNGFRQITFPFSDHFRKICKEQGFDWEEGWRGNFLEELTIVPDPDCPACGNKNRERLFPLEPGDHQERIKPIAIYDGIDNEELNSENTGVSPKKQAAALLFGHDTDMIVGLMGTLKTGKVYVPLDPSYPEERLRYMLEDSNARLIVTNSEYYNLAVKIRDKVNKRIPIININEIDRKDERNSKNPGINIHPGNLAYILYTSGSTGNPKGVMQNHRNVLHFARVYTNALHINTEDRLSLFSSYSFDAAKMDIYGALLNGAALYPFDIKQEDNLCRLPTWIKKEGVTIYHSIPTVYRYFTDMLSTGDKFKYLRFIVLGGEAVYKKDVENYKKYFSPGCLFINGLGPTESTVTLQYFIDKDTEIAREAVPVGYAVEDTEVFLIEKNDRETRGYGVGEIVYQSEYLALGYLNNRGKTDEVFQRNPLTGRDRVFCSGDLGRRLMDGSIEYVGRKDFQVKVRGYRIELTEIESRLDKIPGIKKGVVVCKQDQDGENYLTAYYTAAKAREDRIDETYLLNHMKKSLPDYMIPGTFYKLESFPLTATGKVDRKALVDSPPGIALSTSEYTAPSEALQKKIADMWQEVLKVERVGLDDNFFELGGHSLKAAFLIANLHKELNVKIPLAEVFKRPTVRLLSEYIKGIAREEYCPIEILEEKDYYELSYNQKRLWFINQYEPESPAFSMYGFIELKHNVDEKNIIKAVHRIMERHNSFRTGFKVIDDEPVQFVMREVEVKLKKIDLSSNDEENMQKKLELIFTEEVSKPFNLMFPPLYRILLVKLDDSEYRFFFNMHHIITDGWSMGILRREFLTYYEGIRAGKEVALEPLKLQYKDFARWQNNEIANSIFREKSHRFWKDNLLEGIPELELPENFSRHRDDRTGAGYWYVINNELSVKLKKLAKDYNTSLFMVMYSVYLILLSRFSKQGEVISSIINAGREDATLQNIIGFFVNSILFKIKVDKEEPFEDFISKVNNDVLDVFMHQRYPIELVFDELKMKYPDIHVSFNMLNIWDGRRSENRGSYIPYHITDGQEAKFDIEPYISEDKNNINIYWAYKKNLFEHATIETLVSDYIKLLQFFASNPDRSYQEFKHASKKRTILE